MLHCEDIPQKKSLRLRQRQGNPVDNAKRKNVDALNMQLRVACTDGQTHAVRYLLEAGGDPFFTVS